MKGKDLMKLLEADGWIHVRSEGSHRIFKKANNVNNISVPDHGGKDLGKGLVSKILKKAGL